MCDYVSKKELKLPREIGLKWIFRAQKKLKKDYKITFSFRPTGSGKRNLVVKNCVDNTFDLDYELIIQKSKGNININDCKKIKNLFKLCFDETKPEGFSNCEDSTQSLTSKNSNGIFSFDFVILKPLTDNCFFILRNNKNKNNSNNNDYEWSQRPDLSNHINNYKNIKGVEMVSYLRDIYLKKRHFYRLETGEADKKSFQILNEAVNETIKRFY